MKNILFITWDVGKDPGIDLGFITLHYYSLMWILGFAIGYQIMKRIFLKEKVDLKYLEPFFMYALIGCMLGARIGDCVFYEWWYYKDHLLEILLPFKYNEGSSSLFGLLKDYEFTGYRGLASHGATIGFMIATYLYHRKYKEIDLIWLFDRLVICIPIGGALIRIGNFINSEIVGKFSTLPWAVRFPNISSSYQENVPKQLLMEYGGYIPRHPAQLYEAVCYLLLFGVLWYIYTKTNKKEVKGWLFGFFLICLWVIRFVMEFFKEPQGDEGLAATFGDGLNNGQLLSIPFIILGVIIMYRAQKNYNQKNNIQ